jgi:WD40 repeat protein
MVSKKQQFYDKDYQPLMYKPGLGDDYSDPPEKIEVSDWVLSEMQIRSDEMHVKSDLFSGELIRGFALSQNGNLLAKAHTAQVSGQPYLEIWDVATELPIYYFDDIEVNRIAFSPDGRLLAAADKNFVRLYDMENFKEIPSIEEISGKEIMSFDFSPDSRYLAAGFNGGLVLVWDVNSHQIVFTYQEKEQDCSVKYEVLFFPDGKKLAGGSGEGEGCFRVWDLESGENTLNYSRLWEFDTGFIIDIAISSDGAYLALGKRNGDIVVFDTGTWESLDRIQPLKYFGKELPSQIAFLPDSSILAGNKKDVLYLWDLETLEELGSIKMIPWKIVAFPDGKSLAIWGEDGIRFINVEEFIEK